ncbi:MAG: hypothetical protein JXM71_11265 [Spirochaetales bacterium]|nr:hypothetical protein [Spirochaetales bacterium]
MILLEYDEHGFSVTHNGLCVIKHTRAAPCAYVGRGVEAVVAYRGNFDIQDRLEERIGLGDFSIGDDGEAYRVTLTSAQGMSMTLALSEDSGRLVIKPSLIVSPLIAGGPEGPRPAGSAPAVPNRFWFRLSAEPGESVFGGGEQFSHFNLRGRRFPLWTSEQGVGRNKNTRVTWEADVADKAGGDYWWTFFPQPTFASSRHYWLHADCPAYAVFDFTQDGFHELEFWALPESLTVGSAATMLELATDVSDYFGR